MFLTSSRPGDSSVLQIGLPTHKPTVARHDPQEWCKHKVLFSPHVGSSGGNAHEFRLSPVLMKVGVVSPGRFSGNGP
jgi:hypothetical protein